MTSFPKLAERFIAYAKVDTRSDAASTTVPTTYSQVAFTKQLATELESIGLQDVFYNEANGFLTATLPSSVDFPVPVIGFIAHVDTADFHAENIQPLVHENYDGNDVVLNEALQIVLSATEFPNLKDYIGQTLITTDGTTLLGSDDKSGIAEIVTAMETLIQNPAIPHGEIRIAFGPDEEIGTGADRFDAEGFNAAFAYTLDSGRVGHMEYETFNAAQAELTIDGSSVHPGTAYKRMVNALSVAAQFACALPQDEVPELTKDYEGFYMLTRQSGTIDKVEATYIIRDHDKEKFEARKRHFTELVDRFNATFAVPRIHCKLYDQYYNMGDIIAKDMTPVELAKEAMLAIGIDPIVEPFRGGTDGSKITYKGLPTPNLFVGGENFHGKYEFVTVEAMAKATEMILKIIELHTQKNQ